MPLSTGLTASATHLHYTLVIGIGGTSSYKGTNV